MDFKEVSSMPSANLFGSLQSSEAGLSESEAQRRLQAYGKNEIASSETTWIAIVLRQFTSPFFYLLLLAFGVSFLLGEKLDAFMILAFVMVNTLLGFVQEYRSEQTLKLLKKYIVSKVRVIRNGKETLAESTLLVPGDIVFFEPGDIVPADLRLLESYDLTINESALTGESEPMAKTHSFLAASVTEVYQAKNVCFMGTEVASGKGKGIVFATGKRSNYGDIARLAGSAKKESAFEKELGRLSTFILVLVLATLIFVIGTNILIRDSFNYIEFLLFAIALSVSVIPEALPVVTTFSLAIGARNLAKKSVVVKRLSAIEDLGSIEILCSDKTGTLTENVLEAVGVKAKDPEKLLTYAALASTYSSYSRNQGNNAFEIAIAKELSRYKRVSLKTFKKIVEVPFDPIRKRASAIVRKDAKTVLITRGAPETVIPLCDLSPQEQHEALSWVEERGILGVRVLAVAVKKISARKEYSVIKEEKNLELLGFIAFKDPVKPSTFGSLHKAKSLGVQVKIVTGDSKEVAGAVAKDVGLIDSFDSVMTGEEFEKMSIQEQHDVVVNYHVFARVTPQQKHKIITLLKEKHQVGFLGEGINDAPALKEANVAMVVHGASDIAREASDIVLLDTSLQVIVDGIHEGRNVFVNTSKYILATLSANFGNFFAIAIVSLIIDYLPMLPLQILLVNLLSDFPMISVATDTVDEAEVVSPRTYDLKSFAFLSLLLGIVSTFFDFVFFALFRGYGPSTLQTNWFIGSILTELLFIFSIRSRTFFLRSKFPSLPLLALTIIAAEITVFIPYTSIGHEIFKFISPTFPMISLVFTVVILYFVTTEIVKLSYYRVFTKTKDRKILK